MTPSEAAVLLAAIARTDRRTVSETEARSWSELMTKADVALTDAIDAVQHHFGTSRDYLMPIHIIDRVREVRRERLTRAGTPPIPGDLTWQQERDWRRLWCGHVKDGMSVEGAAEQASRSLNLPLELEPATSETVAEERKALVAQLAESKAAPKARPEDHKPRDRKPRTRWGAWSRGDYVEETRNGNAHIVFHPDGNRLWHEGGPYGIDLRDLRNDPGFWIEHIAGKDWGSEPVLRQLVQAWAHITGAGEAVTAHMNLLVDAAYDPDHAKDFSGTVADLLDEDAE